MKFSAAIITTGLIFLGGVSSFSGNGAAKNVSYQKPAVQTVCTVKSCKKTTTHKHHSKAKHHKKTKHYNCGYSNCTITKKHTHKRHYGHHSNSRKSSHHGKHHA